MDIEHRERVTRSTVLDQTVEQVMIAGDRFDAMTRALSRERPRRATLGLFLGAALGLADLAQGKAKGKGGKGKGGKKKKKCKPSANHCCADTDCLSRCDGSVCLSGVCDCFPGRIRHNGVCGNASNVSCQSTLTIVTDPSECCSDEVIFDDGGQMRCAPGHFLCLTPLDCDDFGPCRGFMCTAQYQAVTGCS